MKAVLVSALATGVQAGTLGVTWSDCGAKHATVTDLQPTTVETGATTQLSGSGTVDEEVTSASFTATVSALGVQVAKCSGDGTKDIVCKLPLNTGSISVKALTFPIPAGSVTIPAEVQVSSVIPASLAKVDAHLSATDQNGDSLICLDLHTAPAEEPVAVEAGDALGVTWSDCGAKHATVTDLQPTTIQLGGTTQLSGTGTVDEEVTSASFTATVSALGVQVAKCSGDGTKDIVCSLPLGVGSISVKAMTFPIPVGSVTIPVEAHVSSKIPASLAKVDVHVAATDQNGDSLICLDVHTAKAAKQGMEVVV